MFFVLSSYSLFFFILGIFCVLLFSFLHLLSHHCCSHHNGSGCFTVVGGFCFLTFMNNIAFIQIVCPTELESIKTWSCRLQILKMRQYLLAGGTYSWLLTLKRSPRRSSVPRRCTTSGHGFPSALPCANRSCSSPHPPMVAASTGILSRIFPPMMNCIHDFLSPQIVLSIIKCWKWKTSLFCLFF